jgi:hypothetical protein
MKAFQPAEEWTMDKMYMSAGIVMLVGTVVMAIKLAMMLIGSSHNPGTYNDEMGEDIFTMGLIVFCIGAAIMAFGLANAEPKLPEQ